MQSMTAYARHQTQRPSVTFVWEIRSVNHRYLDVAWRLPEAFRALENSLRESLGKVVRRGKVECVLTVKELENQSNRQVLDMDRVKSILASAEILEQQYGMDNDLSVRCLLSIPNIFITPAKELQSDASDVQPSFNAALKDFMAMRQTEGKAIYTLIHQRVNALLACLGEIRDIVKTKNQQIKTTLLGRLQILQSSVDEQRIEEEIALLLMKMDISEEVERLEAHAHQVLKEIDKPGAIGRRLDFMMQELHREANTVCSKSDDVALTQIGVEMKVIIEQMREQIQNIE